MTYLALNLSHYQRRGEKAWRSRRHMFAHYVIDAITNGVHAATWTSPPFQTLYDQYIPGWREDNSACAMRSLSPPRRVGRSPHCQAPDARGRQPRHPCRDGCRRADAGFARRATAYKRMDLLFQDIERLHQLAARAGGLQVIYAGKAHPQDQQGKELIQRIYAVKDLLKNDVKIAYLANYDIAMGASLTAGVDVWLNTPQPPLEASGTSGMKAALNGVPSLSVLDGWWLEGCIEGDGLGHWAQSAWPGRSR